MHNLTKKQKDILEYIEIFADREGMAPTVYEIGAHFDIKTSTVFAHLRALQRKSQITRSSKARSISLLKRKKSTPPTMSLMLPIPLLGRINAGATADNQEFKEGEIFVSPQLLDKADSEQAFALRVQGQSMRDLGIYEDDIIIVKACQNFRAGDIIVAMVDNETTVKSYYPLADGMIELRPANEEFQSQIYPGSQVQMQGKVVGLQRQY